MNIDQIRQMRQDARWGNEWRHDASVDEDYYDGNHYDAETAQQMRDAGLPLTVIPISRDIVQTAVGLQYRAKRDWIVRPEADDRYNEMAQAISLKLKEAEDRTNADEACMEAITAQYRSGLGWVEVGRNESLLEYPYSVRNHDWREFWWDPRSKAADIVSDAEYVRRLRFFEKDQVRAAFPRQVNDIIMAGADSEQMAGWYEPERYWRDSGVRDMTQVSLDIWGANRDLVALEEIYYRVRTKGWAARMPSGQWTRFDPDNPVHRQAYNLGIVQPVATTVKKMHRAVVCGDHVLIDGPSPHPHDDYPWVPFVYEREGRTGAVYGAIRVIRSLQDEVNTSRARMQWANKYSQVIADDDAVEDIDIAQEEVNRPDSWITLNSNRKASSRFEIDRNYQMGQQQFQAYQDALALIPQVSGVPRSLSGQQETGVTSGVQVQELVDQGMNAQGRPSANAARGRKQVGKLLLANIIADMGDAPQTLMAQGRDGRTVRVAVNQPARDERSGFEYVKNAVKQAKLLVTLDEAPANSTFRRQQLADMLQMIGSIGNNPAGQEAVTAFIPLLVEASDLPGKDEVVKQLRRKLGLEPRPPENEQEARQMQAESEQRAQERELALRREMAEIAKTEAGAAIDAARAQSEQAKISKTAAEIDKILVGIEETRQDMAHQQQVIEQGGVEAEARIHW